MIKQQTLLTLLFCLWSVKCFILDHADNGADNSLPALAEPPLRIGSFNIQVFGTTKFSHTDVVNILVAVS